MSIKPAAARERVVARGRGTLDDRQGPPRPPRSESGPAARRDGGTRAARPGAGVDSSRRPSHSSSAGVRGDRAGRRSRAGHRASSRRSRSSAVSTLIHGAASSRASGSASSRRQIAVTVGPFADVRRKSGCTSRTRSTNSRTAGERARSAGDVASDVHLQRERSDGVLPLSSHTERGAAGDQHSERRRPMSGDPRPAAPRPGPARNCRAPATSG